MDSTQGASTTNQSILCDAACKQVLTSKPILARIMKSCFIEYEECDLDTIENTLIEGKPELPKDPVFPGETLINAFELSRSLAEQISVKSECAH